MKKENGFTLYELLVVMVIVGIVSVFSLIGYRAVKSGMSNNLQRTRLMDYAQAQEKFRTSGERRYGTMKELCQAGLLTEVVAKMDSSCNTQTAVNGWSISPGTETSAFLKNHFFAKLTYTNRPEGDQTPAVCIAQDGILRIADSSNLDNCSSTSTPYQP